MPCLILAACLLAPVPPGTLTLELTPAKAGANLLPNASFEQLTNGVPDGWQWSKRNTDATLTPVQPGRSGRYALRITNGTPFGAHVYGQLYLADVKVEPNTDYTFTLYVRCADSPGAAWFGGGEGWRVRVSLPATGGAWRRVSKSFRTGATETHIPVMINTDSPTRGFDVDDLQLEAGTAATAFDAPDTVLPPQVALAAGSDLDVEPAPWKPELFPPGKWAFAAKELVLRGGVSVPAPGSGTVEVELKSGATSLARERLTVAELPRQGKLTARFGLPAAPPETVDVRAVVRDAGGRELASESQSLRLVAAASIEASLAATEQRLPALEGRAAADDDVRVTATVVRNFLAFSRQDIAHGALARAYDTAGILARLTDEALARPARGKAPHYVTGPLTIDGPTFRGTAELPDGRREQRPIWFFGYGHFGQVRKDVEQFPAYGANIFQVEFGPNSVLPAEGQVSTQAIDDFAALCGRAAKANVAVNLLLSPHYFPGWALAKWPHLRNFDGGFFQYDIYAPEAKAVLEQYLRVVIPRIKDLPALHSLCLSNEPLAVDLSRSATAAAMWHRWLAEHVGPIEAVNRRWGTTFATLDAVPVPAPKLVPSAMVYDFTLFNQESFAGWHRWLADVIHSMAPNLPVHAKIMIGNHFQRAVHGDWSIAPELFGELSQINGNDCWKWPRSTAWACDWVAENMGYDYQRSAADRPVFNSENHLILDRDVNPIAPAFIRNVYWQGALHGQGATTTWVWERTYEANSDLAGSILHRPECVEAAGRCANDLNRAALEVAALASEPFQIALCWSQASSVWRSGAHGQDVARAYVAANFLDQPVGFVNERDAESYLAGRPDRAFGLAKVILVPGVSHATPATVQALRKFAAAGGRVVQLGECFTHDDAGREVKADVPGERWPMPADAAGQQALWQRLRAALPGWGLAPRCAVGTYGVEVRSAAVGGRTVLNACNYLKEPATITLPAGGRDALTGEPVAERLTLEPLEARLVKW